MHFDRVANQNGYGVRVTLVTPKGVHTSLVVKLKYTSTNDTTKYEAYIIRMEVALSLGVDKIDIFGESSRIIS